MSTEEQANNGYSIRAQIEKLTLYCELKEWNVVDIYSDEGISGKNINERSSLIRLVNDIKSKKVNNVLVYKIDRLTRSTKDLIELIELFNKYDCSFNSLNESIDTKTSTGRMFIKIIGIFAEFERENIVERVKLGLERKVKEGYTIANKNLSYGYKKEFGNKIQVVDKKEAKIVNMIYDLFLEGYTYSKIAKKLNSCKVSSKNGKCWSYKTIKLILQNPNYIGNVRYGINTDNYFECLGRHKSIVNKKKYFKVKEILNTYRKKHLDDSIFGNKVFCMCGKKLLIKKYNYILKDKEKKTYIRYVCGNKNCVFKSISEKDLEKQLVPIVDNWSYLCLLEKKVFVNEKIDKIILNNKMINKILYCSK